MGPGARLLPHGAAREKGDIMPEARLDNALDGPGHREKMPGIAWANRHTPPDEIIATIKKIEAFMGGLG
jgi:hypothetical protein